MVKVSVIIPAYNGDRYIGEAIESVLAQTYDDYELIVIDDGSTDNTYKVIQQKCDRRLQYYCQTNQGVAASRNFGLNLATGEYIAFLDQDDLFLPDKLVNQVALLEENPNLGIVNSGWQIIDEHNTATAAIKPWEKIPQLNLQDIIVWKPVFLGAMLFRHSWLKHSGGFDTSLQQTPDVDLVLRLASLGCAAAWVKAITVKYRQHENNASKNTLLQAQELNLILNRFFEQDNIASEIKVLAAKSHYQSLLWSAWRLYTTGHLTAMSDYLDQSHAYSPYPTINILNWIEAFKNYSLEYGKEFDFVNLTASRQWQALIGRSLV
ncbi:glycosyl transferase family protein [Chondrocystis sp. NIES-4102]|nr:glycosyl transferase family protein [Chondrocystis sp. NIES-4102]